MNDKPFEFREGDVVSFGGISFAVEKNERFIEEKEYPLFVDGDIFTADGRISIKHKEPLLKLIERPKRKVTKTVEAWANVYTDGEFILYHRKQHADERADLKTRIACVKLTGSYEVEE